MTRNYEPPRLFSVSRGMRDTGYHRRQIAKAGAILDSMDGGSGSVQLKERPERLAELDGIYSSLMLSCRNAMENDYYRDDEDIGTGDVDQFRNLAVSASFENGALVMRMPLTFANDDVTQIYALGDLAAAAIEKMERQGRPLYEILKGPLHVAVIRKTDRFRRRRIRDNDNLEVSNVINRVFRAAMISDEPVNMSFSCYFHLVPEGEEGVEMLIFPLEDLKRHADYLCRG